MGKEVETYVIETEYEGLTFQAWVTESGDVLKEYTPMGWTMLREDRKVAEDFRGEAGDFRKDIAQLVAVRTDVHIDDPENTWKSELFISGIDLGLFELEGAGQRLVDPETGLVRIVMRRPDPEAAMQIPIADDSLAEHLQATLLIQSDDREIKDLAASIAGDETNSLIVAERINQWVFDNIDKKITFSLPSAVEVLETREGDCNEHTALYVALARAAGIPSQIAVGLVYHKGSFYYHAWPEVYVGEWVAMDPTFGQSPADATHVRLLAGGFEEQVKLTQALGKISLKIKSFSYPSPEPEEPA
jgi:transglutaminase-like putative cysteine protease